MEPANVSDRLRLKVDIPELGLCCGQVGVLCSTWFSPATAYEVEFALPHTACKARALLLPHQVEIANIADLPNR